MMSNDGAKPLMKTPAACILLQVNFGDVLWNMVAGKLALALLAQFGAKLVPAGV